MTNSNGTGVDLSGPLAGMWRDVYRKAGEVADARARELLKYHVYTYPHGAGGGGGGGGGAWSLVEKLTVSTPTARLAFASVPAAGDCLLLISRGSVTAPSGNGAYYGLSFNGDPYPGTTDKYRYVMSDVSGEPATAAQHLTTGTDRFAYLGFMGASQSGATVNDGGGVSICTLPDFAAPERLNAISDFQIYHTTLNSYGARIVGGRYSTVYDAHGPLTALAVQCGNALQFDAGSTFALYVLSPTGGGGDGGGGTADVTITTDASLTATEAPANTFALAARLSPDAGNALSLHANGLYSTDTGTGGGAEVTITTDASLTATESPANTFALATRLSPDAGNALALRGNGLYATDTSGGGGTGNTTMYTQTATPAGATNSLWFNPSESA